MYVCMCVCVWTGVTSGKVSRYKGRGDEVRGGEGSCEGKGRGRGRADSFVCKLVGSVAP